MNQYKRLLKSVRIRKIVRYFVLLFLLPFILITVLILHNLFASFMEQTMQEQLFRTQRAMENLQNWPVTFERVVTLLVGDSSINLSKLHLYSQQSALQSRLQLVTFAHTGLDNIWYELPDGMGFLSGNDALSIPRMNGQRFHVNDFGDAQDNSTSLYDRLCNGEILSVFDQYNGHNCLLYPMLIHPPQTNQQTLLVFEVNLDTIIHELETLFGTFPGMVRLRTANGQVLCQLSQAYAGEFADPLPCPQSLSEPYAVWTSSQGGLLQGKHIILTSVANYLWAIDLISLNDMLGHFQVMQSVSLLLMIVLVLGFCVCIGLTLRLYQPIRSIRDSLSGIGSTTDENTIDDYEYIESSIELLSSDNQQLRSLLLEHTKKSREFVAAALFSGRIRSVEEFQEMYAFCGFVPTRRTYVILAAPELPPALLHQLSACENYFSQTTNHYHTVFCCGADLLPGLQSMGASCSSEDWALIPLHCAQAWFACSMGQRVFTPVLCQQALEKAGKEFQQTFDQARNEGQFDALYALRQQTDKLHDYACALAASLLQWMEELKDVLLEDASIFYISASSSVADQRSSINTLLSLMEQWLEPEEKEAVDMLEQMYQYIAKQYDSPDFSIKQMASDFSMSISALSGYFKKKAGVLLSDYITDMKMKKATHLLEYSNLSTQEVGLAIGYLNVNSFARRFQQLYHMSPKEYRSMQRTKQ